MKNCRLCSDLLCQSSAQTWNEPLFESPNFVVLPSLGALVEGWLLLVPKKHYICMGALPDSVANEMLEVKHFLCSVLHQYYGQISAFEHGPCRPNSRVGCSVDHAHLHILPISFDLAAAVAPFLPKDVRWSAAGVRECQAAFGQEEDYLYLEQPIGAGRIAIHKEFESQLFRRAIAMQLGALNQFNWREYPQLPNVSATIDKWRATNGNVSSCKNRLEVAA